MSAPDFAAILAPFQTFTAGDGATGIRIREASELLAAKVPELCQTCSGLGCTCVAFCEQADDHVCPDCPTIGRLLAIGAAVMTLPNETTAPIAMADGRYVAPSALVLVQRLRAVQP